MTKFDMSAVSDPQDKNILEEEDAAEKPQGRELLTEQVIIKLPPSEKRILEKQAQESGLKLSPLVRSYLKKYGYI